ncbi:MAG TPA: hypothetical protein VHR39_04095 [Propionibacteriaceae bacterium]|nr:hypothetical protein [Propionibacteriaceae bacterium]
MGLGADLGGLTTAKARRVVADIDGAAEVVALTMAESGDAPAAAPRRISTARSESLSRLRTTAEP